MYFIIIQLSLWIVCCAKIKKNVRVRVGHCETKKYARMTYKHICYFVTISWNRSLCFRFFCVCDERAKVKNVDKLLFCVLFERKEHVFTFKFCTFCEWVWKQFYWTGKTIFSLSLFSLLCSSVPIFSVQCSISNVNWKVENEHSSAVISFILCVLAMRKSI